ncbi:DUF1624 domain-containing protein [Myxococcus xanthus]|uniref:DUF1624 domain-containing protein n=1 Tax=Myxococcus xanthus TaxID=34 RepID=UPI001C103386|nr:hypothetical protein [Myxococcus xanthus]
MTQLARTPRPDFAAPSAASSRETVGAKGRRIVGIDALRGLVMALMIVDHVRKYFYLHAQVSAPVVISATPPSLFFTRFAAHLCAPVFVIRTGVVAWLHGQRHERRKAASSILYKRRLFLLVLELTVINFAWSFTRLPRTCYFQVIGPRLRSAP